MQNHPHFSVFNDMLTIKNILIIIMSDDKKMACQKFKLAVIFAYK